MAAASKPTIGELIYNTTSITLLEADVLLAFVLKKDKEFLYGNPDKTVTAKQAERYQDLVDRRASGEPTAYLVDHKEFYDLDFMVQPGVLIPRPDTELLVEIVMADIDTKASNIVDIGTGAGPIAVTLKHHLPQVTMYATDISADALKVARKNAKLNTTDITFYRGDVLTALPQKVGKEIDTVIFNAPYLTKTEARKQMLAHEPQVALTPEGKPTELIERLFQQLQNHAPNWQRVYLEFGHRQAKQIQTLADKYIEYSDITVFQDLGGYDRVIRIVRHG